MITAINYIMGNEYFWTDQEYTDRTNLEARTSRTKRLEEYSKSQQCKLVTKWPIFHAYLDNQVKLFNLKPIQAYTASDLKAYCESPVNMRSFFTQQEHRSFIMLAHYYPETMVMKPQAHVFAVRYSRNKRSYIVYGLSNGPKAEPKIVNECTAELTREFLKIRALRVLNVDEYLVSKHEYWGLERRAKKYVESRKERIWTDEMFRVNRRSERSTSARKA